MNAVERVRRAIRFEQPDRVPMLFFNRDRRDGDIIMLDIQNHFGGPEGRQSEWGFQWEQLDATMGQPLAPALPDWKDFSGFRPPTLNEEARRAWVEAQKAHARPDQYLLASLQLSGFTVMTFLRGFAALMEDFYEEPELAARLADLVFGFETRLIEFAAREGFHGIAFFDDWGTQRSMMISPALWRAFFAPRYRAQFARAHALSLDVYFHSCGKYDPILGDFFDLGVDMLNISQPNLYDLEALRDNYGGRGCFVLPVSYQTTSISGTREDIFRDVRRAVDCLGCFGGGLVGYIEDYPSMGMPEENYRACVDAFRVFGDYSRRRWRIPYESD